MIAVDVMGGDRAPDSILQGALAAAKKSVPVLLCGPEDRIRQWLTRQDPLWERYGIAIDNAPNQISMDEEPVFAVRKKNDSSLVKAVESVAQGRCTAVLSAGNSGALMVAAALVIGREQSVERPAIAGFLPTKRGQDVLGLDLGANTECRPGHLIQFAHMGDTYARQVMKIERPRVALLANGHEEGKGSLLVKETHVLLKREPLNFVGNIEPYGIIDYNADVVVCDGFSGNIMLKTMETMSDLFTSWVGDSFGDATRNRLAHNRLGGALLLGVKRSVIVCHGGADADAIERAISFAWDVAGA